MDRIEAADITSLFERLGRVLQNDGHAVGLKPVQWEALRYLQRANRFSRNPSAVTSYLGITKGTVSQTLIALERKSLISKKTDDRDRRNIQLELTKTGRELLDDDPLSRLSKIMAQLPHGTRAQLNDNLQLILRQLLKDRGERPFGACMNCRYFQHAEKKDNQHHCQLLDTPLSADDSKLHCIEMEPT